LRGVKQIMKKMIAGFLASAMIASMGAAMALAADTNATFTMTLDAQMPVKTSYSPAEKNWPKALIKTLSPTLSTAHRLLPVSTALCIL